MYLIGAMTLIAVVLSTKVFRRAFPFESLAAFALAGVTLVVLLQLSRAG